MHRPSDYYARYLRRIYRIAVALLVLVFLVLLLDVMGVLGGSCEGLVQSWKAGRSPFWTKPTDPFA